MTNQPPTLAQRMRGLADRIGLVRDLEKEAADVHEGGHPGVCAVGLRGIVRDLSMYIDELRQLADELERDYVRREHKGPCLVCGTEPTEKCIVALKMVEVAMLCRQMAEFAHEIDKPAVADSFLQKGALINSLAVDFHYVMRRPSQPRCSGCGSQGFAQSALGPGRCEFCDGSVGGVGPNDAVGGDHDGE